MDFKTAIVQRVIDITGNIIADQLSKPDWEARRENISQYYKDLQPIKDALPESPTVREIPEQRGENGKEKAKMNEIIDEVCTPDLSPKELMECQECVRAVVEGSDTDVMQKYFKSSP